MSVANEALRAGKQLKNQVVETSRAVAKDVYPLADEALAFGATALAAARPYAKAVRKSKASKWLVAFFKRNPVTLGVSAAAIFGLSIYAWSRRT